MAGERSVYWSGEAKLQVDLIKESLRKAWSEREVSAIDVVGVRISGIPCRRRW